MYGDYVEINIEVIHVTDNAVKVFVNGEEKEEWIPLSMIKESYPLMFLEGDTYQVDIPESLAFERGWI